MDSNILFDRENTSWIHCSHHPHYWEFIVAFKHPVMRGRETEVQENLREPDEIRRSRNDPTVHLFYRMEHPRRWTCAVAKRLNNEGFLITTFATDAIKEEERIWTR